MRQCNLPWTLQGPECAHLGFAVGAEDLVLIHSGQVFVCPPANAVCLAKQGRSEWSCKILIDGLKRSVWTDLPSISEADGKMVEIEALPGSAGDAIMKSLRAESKRMKSLRFESK